MLNQPRAVCVDSAGNLFIADTFNNRIRKVDAETHIITSVAGTGQSGFSGDNGPAAAATLNQPFGVVLDRGGNVYIADTENNRIRKIAAGSTTITTIAGNGSPQFSGDGLQATAAGLSGPRTLTFDAAGNLLISDTNNNRIRRVAIGTGIISTVAGVGPPAFAGDGGPATASYLFGPSGIAFSPRGDLFFADWANSRIRAIRGPIP
jgi:sugar lactone lactonase YvrE